MIDGKEVLDLLGVSYDERGGRLQLVCVLPEHADTDPSMAVFLAEGRFKCFGCDATGDLIDLFARANSLDRARGISKLSDLLGYPVAGSPALDSKPERVARERGETALKKRGDMEQKALSLFGDRLDKICWCYRKRVIDADALHGAIVRFIGDVEAA